jgi:hypothetical protein
MEGRSALEQRLEEPVHDVLRVERRTDAGREHQPRVLVMRGPYPFLNLPPAVASEGFYGPMGQRYGSAAGILRLGEF